MAVFVKNFEHTVDYTHCFFKRKCRHTKLVLSSCLSVVAMGNDLRVSLFSFLVKLRTCRIHWCVSLFSTSPTVRCHRDLSSFLHCGSSQMVYSNPRLEGIQKYRLVKYNPRLEGTQKYRLVKYINKNHNTNKTS